MKTGYHIDDTPPKIGQVHAAFRSLETCKQFAFLQGGLPTGDKIYEIKGELVKDEGSPDGLYIKVREFKIVP